MVVLFVLILDTALRRKSSLKKHSSTALLLEKRATRIARHVSVVVTETEKAVCEDGVRPGHTPVHANMILAHTPPELTAMCKGLVTGGDWLLGRPKAVRGRDVLVCVVEALVSWWADAWKKLTDGNDEEIETALTYNSSSTSRPTYFRATTVVEL